ncbi:nickel pincer cofactor biosynthesis protein LarC [Treponema pedis]|uniref:Putative nickel insertion protein n=1 Tax=Treponema pedis str. T A4 TaxID=1291379 RepID=S5ZL69_9SPIR|nr:nickel pincer cofactor biosynthesis protein LarC [Treponema pedis]AGT43322.1 hypothetical protein TPE_0826 [Treponema pedis str. T A4]
MILYLDCFSGISGNMFLGSMLELGIDFEWLKSELKKLNLPDEYEITAEKTERCGISGTYVNVILPHEHSHCSEHSEESSHCDNGGEHFHNHSYAHSHSHKENGLSHSHSHEDHHHSHEHEHNHEHNGSHHHIHRNLYDIHKIIDDSTLSQNVKDKAKNIFQFVANAESKIHNKPFEELHFHEVGATDSIIDIVGAAICLEKLKPEKIYASSVALGSGFVHCAHGKIPVPAPATLEILKAGKIPGYTSDIKSELVTPTGAAILATIVDEFRCCPEMILHSTAYGAGTRDNPVPNMLRILMGETLNSAKTQNTGSVTEAVFQVDDMTGEALGFLMEKLFTAGAVDVYFSSIYMKKNRPAVKVTVLYKKELHEKITHIIFKHSSTLGFRFCEKERIEMSRKIETIKSSDGNLGEVKIKTAEYKDIKKESIEYEALKKTADALGLSLDELSKKFFKER